MRKVLTVGVYDYFHIGHLRLFKQCKEYGDYLIVAVQTEEALIQYKPASNVFYSTEERIEMVSGLKIVDEVITYDHAFPEFFSKIDFDVLALGEDQNQERFEKSAQWCIENGRSVVRLKRTVGISSTNIKKEVSALS